MHLLSFCSVIDAVAWRGMFFTVFILQFVFACQLLLLQPLFAALDGKPGNAAGLFERVSQSIKVKHYSEALNDLNAAIEADPTLSEAYYHRGSVLRQLCRYEESEKNYRIFLDETWELSCRKGALSIASGAEHSGNSF